MFETLSQAVAHYANCIGCSISEAKGDAERAIQQMVDKGMTREFAESSWIEDVEDMKAEELDAMEKKAKANKALARGSNETKERKQTKRERKPNDEKRTIMNWLRVLFEGFQLNGECSDVNVTNVEKEISFFIGENHYSLSLICHRKPKG